jgi:AraC-like DNA-binding protein/ligand-binding sensor protein
MQPNLYTDTLVDDICNYIDFLQLQFHCSVTVHHVDAELGSYFYRFLNYQYHSCWLCREVKRSSKAWQHCIDRQDKVLIAVSNQPILGTCYAGVTEFVFPLKNFAGKALGFLCLSGFLRNPEDTLKRVSSVSHKYRLRLPPLLEAMQSLKEEIPDFHTVALQIAPLQHMFSLLFHFANSQETVAEPANSKEALSAKIFDLINHHFRDPAFSLRELSKLLNMNYSYISHVFSELSPKSFSQTLHDLRIESAKKYLEYTDESISMIASTVGFNDSNYFSAIFRKETGFSPTEWREQHLKPD